MDKFIEVTPVDMGGKPMKSGFVNVSKIIAVMEYHEHSSVVLPHGPVEFAEPMSEIMRRIWED